MLKIARCERKLTFESFVLDVGDRISDSEKSQFYYPSAGLGTIPNYYVA